MSTTVKALQGDTFGSVARRVYGTETEGPQLRESNPGASEPLTAGTVLFAPPLPTSPARLRRIVAQRDPEDVSVRIGGQLFTDWEAATIVRAVDSVDTLELVSPFDPADPVARARFRPFTFSPTDVLIGGRPFFTGTRVGVTPRLTTGARTMAASSYALPGVLGDCTMPASAYPIEYNGLNLAQIAARVCRPFGVAVDFTVDPGPRFEQVACRPGERVLDFLSGLAKQRGIVIGSTRTGRLAFRRSASRGRPVANLVEGELPVLSVVPAFDPQQYYSDVTGLAPVGVGSAGSQHTVRNPRLRGTLRPITFTVTDAEDGTIVQAVQAKAGRMFANMVAYTVRLCTWRDPSGALWAPNTTVNLRAPGAMVYTNYEMEIRSVRFTRDVDSEVAELNLILPGSFAGRIPEALPWDG